MQSTIAATNKSPEYPCLKEFTGVHGKFVVLFTTPYKGVVVSSTNPNRPVGDGGDTWIKGDFSYFTGTVELSN